MLGEPLSSRKWSTATLGRETDSEPARPSIETRTPKNMVATTANSRSRLPLRRRLRSSSRYLSRLSPVDFIQGVETLSGAV